MLSFLGFLKNIKRMMSFIKEHIWFILFFIWGLPLTYYRSKFRKIVYKTDSWTINIKPVFMKEIRALMKKIYPKNRNYLRFRRFYSTYLIIYFMLFGGYIAFGNNKETQNTQKMKKLEIGSDVPIFTLKDQFGNDFNIESVIGKKNLVIFFYPKDDSPGCTKQACSFRDNFSVFEKEDAIIIGINPQSPKTHLAFAKKYKLKYLLLSDSEKRVQRFFGVKGDLFGLFPGRVTFIIDKKGKVVHRFKSQLKPEKHISEALRILKGLE